MEDELNKSTKEKYKSSWNELAVKLSRKKTELENAFNVSTAKLLVENIMGATDVYSIKIKIEFQNGRGIDGVEHLFGPNELYLLAPLMNMKAMDVFELSKLGTEKV